MTTMMNEQQAPAAPVAEQEILIQTSDMEEYRWADLRSDMVGVLKALTNKLGYHMILDEKAVELGMCFPIDDSLHLENGEFDRDFEESSIEALLKIQRDFLRGAAVAERFAHNLRVRDHSDREPTASA